MSQNFDLNGNLLNNWAVSGLVSDVAVLASPAVTWNSAASSGMYSNGANWSASTGAASAYPGKCRRARTLNFCRRRWQSVTVNGQFTVGTLAFNSTAGYILQAATGSSSITLNNNGLGGLVTVPGGQTHAINTNLILTDIGSTGFNIASGGTLNIGGSISGTGALALTGGGNLVVGPGGSIGNLGGATIENGQLMIGTSGSISGSLKLVVAYGYNGELDLASPSTTLSSLMSSTDGVAGTTATVNLATNSTLTTPTFSVTGTLNFNSAASSNGSIAINAAPTLAAGSQLNLHAGTLSFDITNGGSSSVGSGVSVAIAAGATLQLAGAVSVLSDGSAISPASGNLATVANSGSFELPERINRLASLPAASLPPRAVRPPTTATRSSAIGTVGGKPDRDADPAKHSDD